MVDCKPTTPLESALSRRLEARFLNSTLRKLTIAPKDSVDFSSNDFLSLSTSPVLRSAFIDELSRHPDFPLGSGGSRLLDGNSTYACELESDIAAFHGAEAGLLFNSGFDANAGLFACIPQPGDIILFDELVHASVHDGMKLSRAARHLPFKHNDLDSLRRIILALKAKDTLLAKGPKSFFIAVESIYSMDGDLCPLRELVDLLEEVLPYGNGHVVIDEAHATGVLGPRGRGLVSDLGLERKIFARLHTFGKGVGASGAIVLCTPLVRSYLLNYARPLIYTTFMPFINLAAIRASYTLLRDGQTDPLQRHLQELTSYLHTRLLHLLAKCSRIYQSTDNTLFVSTACPQSPIFALLTDHPRSLAAKCQGEGLVVRAVVPPTVPTRRVRVCLHAGNNSEQVDRLISVIEAWVREQVEGRGTFPNTVEKARL